MKSFDQIYRYLRPSMLQHLLRRLVFDVPILNEYAKMPLKVHLHFCVIVSLNVMTHNSPSHHLEWSLQTLIGKIIW